jgi:ketosteroid isomerase-like protein
VEPDRDLLSAGSAAALSTGDGISTPLDVSESYWTAECRRDIDGVISHYHPDATYEGPDGLRRGHDQIRTGYKQHMSLYPGLEVAIVQDFSRGDYAAIEFDAVLIDTGGKRYRVRGVNVVQIRGGRFVSVRSYEDPPVPE